MIKKYRLEKVNKIKVICNIFIFISILFHFNFYLNTNKSYADLYEQEKNFNKQNIISGHFKKLNIDNKNIKINGHGIKLKDGRVLFPHEKNMPIFNPKDNSFSFGADMNNIELKLNEGFVLNNGNVLFIGPLMTTPFEKFRSEIVNKINEELYKEEKRNYKRPIGMSLDEYNGKIMHLVNAKWNNLSFEEQENFYFPYIKNDTEFLKKYNEYKKSYDDSMYAQLYNPKTNTYSKTGKVTLRRSATIKIQLKDGRVFMLGGFGCIGKNNKKLINKIEIFNPKTGEFTLLNTDNVIDDKSVMNVLQLKDNRILIFINSKVCEYVYYDIENNSFSEIKKLPFKYCKFINLSNGNILFFTNKNAYDNGYMILNDNSKIVIFNPYKEEIEENADFVISRGETGFGAVELKDNRILVFGGEKDIYKRKFKGSIKVLDNAEIVDLKAKKSQLIGKMNYGHFNTEGILLDNGNVLIYEYNAVTPELYEQ